MKLEDTLKIYENTLREGNIHAHIVNSCFDRCGHCYVSTVPEYSSRSKFLNTEDFLHFVGLLRQNKSRRSHIGLSGGDPLLHPEIITILDELSKHSDLEVLTSGFALSARNNRNRKELSEACARSKASFRVASPDEAYHSITWDDITEIREYIKDQGYNPNRLGYPSKNAELVRKAVLASTIVGGVGMAIAYLLERYSNGDGKPKVIPIGRAKGLPQEQKFDGVGTCSILDRSSEIYVNYKGDLQYCLYTVHSGFMNIEELRGVEDKEEAIQLILKNLADDLTFKDMTTLNKCYFSKKVRK